MSKAILVMDMPNNCRDCVLCIASQEKHNGQFCWRCVNSPTIMIEKNGTKPDWCPLVEVPTEVANSLEKYAERYNACIDEIMKGSEENG